MTNLDELIQELNYIVNQKGIKERYDEIIKLLGTNLKEKKIISFHITTKVSSDYPESLLDVLVLTEGFVYDFVINYFGHERIIVKTNSIVYSSETISKEEILIEFQGVGGTGITVVDTIERKNKMSNFFDAVLAHV